MMSNADVDTNRLIQDSQGLVRMLAIQIHARMPSYLELDDLVSYGQVGLAQAARDYRPDLGTKFSTYAYYRIRGAIYDGAVKMSWMNRSWRRHSKFSRMADEFLEIDAQETDGPGQHESDPNWLQRVAGSLAVIHLATQFPSGDRDSASEIADENAEPPEAEMAHRELVEQLHQLIAQLPPESAQLIRAVYFEELTLQEAGVRYGFSKSWASRLHARALEQLARGLRELDLAL